ncbi:MAG: UvrD-helicase domain-containing protein [Alphaproteobacteria bacterium]|nr:UvrD-helicase domain-containing protein [Alphaproteobacteria bacterium]
MSSKREFSKEQAKASDPTQNVWVQANAGTGKTSVLVQRLLRILLKSTDTRDGILCLTYTNAGAGEMRNRVLAELRKLAMAEDKELRDLLHGINHGSVPTESDLVRARTIFYEYIDNPGMLKIRTIHGFCEEILRRFPMEAGIAPAWHLVSGADQKRLLKDVFQELVGGTDQSPLVKDAFSRILDQVSEYSLDDLLNIITGQYRHFFKIRNNFNYREQYIDNIKQFLKINESAKTKFHSPAAATNRNSIPDMVATEAKPAGYLLKISEAVKKFTGENFEEYKCAFLTATGTKISNVAKKDYLAEEQELVHALDQENTNREIFENSVALFDLTDAFVKKYSSIKHLRATLDFDDLILHVNKLFSDPAKMGWILSQLDNNLKHILIDEAQDTSPEQWEIMCSMTTNFFTDGDKTENPRSLFVVGDAKQSIFSFQGANPRSFSASKDTIDTQIKNDQRRISEVPLSQSFRSTAPILSSVDYFFNDISISSLSKFENNHHKIFRNGDAGLVELHPLSKPAENQDTAMGRHDFICKIAGKIESLLCGERLESADRNILPSDIMILVQRRAPFAAPLIEELQSRNIPVAGSDRIRLPDFPAIRDLLNTARFALDPTDDYLLACILKSPFFRMNEAELFDLCRNRQYTDLFSHINGLNNECYKQIEQIIVQKSLSPYSFFMWLLNTEERREKLISALGRQAIDPLEEFLTICLSYERTRPGGLKEFIRWFTDGANEIIRDIDASAGVRIVTTHSSKGLEAPIIFLVDTIRTPRSANAVRIAEPIPIPNTIEYGNPFLWKGRAVASERFLKAIQEKYEIQLEEYYRLLYVAMTRARDRLYIYGFNNTKEPPIDAWHTTLSHVIPEHPNAITDENGITRIACTQEKEVPKAPGQDAPPETSRSDTKTFYDRPKREKNTSSTLFITKSPLNPDFSNKSLSDIITARESRKYAIEAGEKIHRQLSHILIDGDDTNGDAKLIEKIRTHPEIARFFEKNSRAEVPVAGFVNGKFISRRIDRMIVTSDIIEFVDFKTDTDKTIHRDKYTAQVAEYEALLRTAFPNRTIHGYILWLHDWELESFI